MTRSRSRGAGGQSRVGTLRASEVERGAWTDLYTVPATPRARRVCAVGTALERLLPRCFLATLGIIRELSASYTSFRHHTRTRAETLFTCCDYVTGWWRNRKRCTPPAPLEPALTQATINACTLSPALARLSG